MFDFAWSEIALIGIVALVAIGPKDLPVAIKAVSQMVKKARKMAGEFQTHVDEMVREANLHEVRDSFNDLRRMDIKGKLLNAVDDDGTIRKTLSEKVTDFSPAPPPVPVHDIVQDIPVAQDTPLETTPVETTPVETAALESAPLPEVEVPVRPEPVQTGPEAAPAFVPPRYAPATAERAPPVPPAFIPPAYVPPAATSTAATQIEHA